MHGETAYYYRGSAATVASDKQSMALTVTGQGQVAKQHADRVFQTSLQVQTPPKAIEDGEPKEEGTGSLLPAVVKETWVWLHAEVAEGQQGYGRVAKRGPHHPGGIGCHASLGRTSRGCQEIGGSVRAKEDGCRECPWFDELLD